MVSHNTSLNCRSSSPSWLEESLLNKAFIDFRDIVKASHLTPLAKTEKVVDPDIAYKNVIWNSMATGKNKPVQNYKKTEKKKHFTENKLLDGKR